MQKIKLLPAHEVQKIAAGEVVERPANLLKELIENSLDAHTTAITIYIEQAGKKLIRVIDNGCGMSPEDAKICFQQHATSKISSVDELTSILSFGFRGEALASIAAVSHVTLTTKESAASMATRLTLEKNCITSQESISGNTGTDISVANLFYNVPARLKFLKKDETEWRQISTLFHAFCMAYPGVHFKLFHDSRLIHNCPAAKNISERAAQLWDTLVQDHIVSLAPHTISEITIEGVITNHHFSRYDRNLIYLFINNRWVKNYELTRALMKGYSNVLQAGKFPAATIFITLPPATVDINIHPRKEEVRLLHPIRVNRAIQETIKKTLENNVSAQLKRPVTFATPSPFSWQPTSMPMPFERNFPQKNPFEPMQAVDYKSPPLSIPNQAFEHSIAPIQQTIMPSPQLNEEAELTGTIIGQVHTTYILIDTPDGLYMIDQHAAHERILYEIFSDRFKEVAIIQLAFPQTIELAESEIDTVTPYFDILAQSGIAIERFGATQLIINATPVHAKQIDLKELIKQMISWIHEEAQADETLIKKSINERLHAQMACKAAIKAGDTLDHDQMKQLISDLAKTTNRFSCPHGRPTGWLLSWYEIEKKFKRKL